MLTKAAAGLALASILSAAPAKADMFGIVPDYSADSTHYARQSAGPALVYEDSTAEDILPLERDMLQMPDFEISPREATIEDYLESKGIEPEYEYTTEWWEYPINVAGGLGLNLIWHEFGHYLVANIVGAEDVEMHFFGGGVCGDSIACVTHTLGRCRDRLCRNIDLDRGQLQETLISAAGVGFTTGANLGLTALLKNGMVPDWMRSFTATTSLIMMLDRHQYIWSSAIQHWAGIDNTGSDIENIITGNFASPKARDAAYGVLFAASAIELAFRWEEIWYLMNTAIGKQVEVPEGLGIMPGLYPYGTTLMMGASGTF